MKSMPSCFPKQLSPKFFEKDLLFANVEKGKCRSINVGRHGQMNAMSPSLLGTNFPDCIEKKESVESVERHHCQVSEKGVTTQIQLKLLQKSPFAFEGNAKV